MLAALRRDLYKLANPEKALLLSRFFKTGKGEYGEGDIFLGITVPETRKIAKTYRELALIDLDNLLRSPFHEERLLALLILVYQCKRGDEETKKTIFEFYLSHTKWINNWDLVDLSAGYLVGEYLKDKDRSILTNLAHSSDLWEKRISIIATFAFIVQLKESEDTFAIADILLHDSHDLIHKAVGWMLREVGKRISQDVEEDFLKPRYKTMPRTMLRYAIEQFPEEKRKAYLEGKILNMD